MSGTLENIEARASDATPAGTASAAELAPAAVAAPAAERAACLNCGAPLAGAFCAACGQKADVHRSLAHAIEEFLHGLTHFDGKLWATLPLLLFRPGRLTREYVHGRRARYVSPVALFLLTLFSMFLLFGFLPSPALDTSALAVEPSPTAADALTQRRAELRAITAAIAAAERDPAQAEVLARLKNERDALLEAVAEATERERLQSSGVSNLSATIDTARRSGVLVLQVGNERLNIAAPRALSDPAFVLYKMKQKGYKLSFLLVPMMLPWLMLLFLRQRGVRVYDHVVFLLYSLSAMSLLLLLAATLASVFTLPGLAYAVLFGLLPFVHVLVQLRGAYALGWVAAAWRAAVLSTLGAVTFMAYLLGILLLGVLD